MPKGNPPNAEILGGKISFYSLDTSVIERHSFKFASGSLGLLKDGVADRLKLVLSEVVVREVDSHRTRKARSAAKTLEQAVMEVKRLANVGDSDPLSGIDLPGSLDVCSVTQSFKSDFASFIAAVGGTVLGGRSVSLVPLLDLYSSVKPPFSPSKPNEFKDAMALTNS